VIHGERVYLRQTAQPYVGQIAILLLITVIIVGVAYKMDMWELIFPIPVMWILFSIPTYIGMRYQVYWDEVGIGRVASGEEKIFIKYDDIREIRRQKATLSEMISMSRPFRRIAIFGPSAKGEAQLNVSLRHFRREDVERLMKTIRSRRPDLVLA
jgi:energy-coupling factor transporter transmembrane protein EcfT